CRLYAFVDTSYLHGRAAEAVAEELCQGGADLIQLRAKNASVDAIGRMADAIVRITRRAEVGLVINDHIGIAQEVGADFCHLGQEDFFGAGFSHVSQLGAGGAATAERPEKPGLRIGLSTHAPEEARQAVAAGADYLA